MSANLVWSIALAAVGITGLWLAGSQRRLGWVIGLGAQVLWFVYALATHQYGFIASAVAYGIVYARNFGRRRILCAHVDVVGIYGDEIIQAGFARLWCRDCSELLDGPVSIAVDRQALREDV